MALKWQALKVGPLPLCFMNWLKNFKGLQSAKILCISDKISTSKESNDKTSGGVALLPVSSRLLDIDHFASYRVNAGH